MYFIKYVYGHSHAIITILTMGVFYTTKILENEMQINTGDAEIFQRGKIIV